jgi:hypothetical protein
MARADGDRVQTRSPSIPCGESESKVDHFDAHEVRLTSIFVIEMS